MSWVCQVMLPDLDISDNLLVSEETIQKQYLNII